MIEVRVQTDDFDVGAELARLRAGNAAIGAVASFVGVARDRNDGSEVATLTLEHYPGMTERALQKICAEAAARWNVIDILVVHRVGRLEPLDQIVLVAVTSAHRGESFACCQFVMDYLKTEAPFWKKENTAEGARWVNARDSDTAARERWSDGQGSAAGNEEAAQ
jgi:molybdopterin synthase catalytic subunit